MYDVPVDSKARLGLSLPSTVKVAYLFCLLGLAISAAVLPHYSPDDVTWIMTHLE
jgi:flagellar motor switch protein FliG